ncbi:MAG: hypothetical protein KJ950_10390 [Proteobacteria bacterium]|nr:hypothetical protein [Pseudomonadota bacterium]MBU1687518.1 hypothetical protein [Pseudomonadota bacterium]
MTKLLRCLAPMLLLFHLTGCGGGGSSSSDETTTTTTTSGNGVTTTSGSVVTTTTSGSNTTTTQTTTVYDKDWTYMVYMGADNNLSTAGIIDLNEMETVGSTSKVNIALQAEFSTTYTSFGDLGLTYDGKTMRMLVNKDNNPDNVNLAVGTSIGNVDMGSPAALTSFIQWAATTYPANHYALVVWDHGGGWKTTSLSRGAVQDETSGTFMSLPDLAKAVSDSGVHLDLINFDACLMAMYEVAYEFKGLTDYLVFSEEVEPGAGDPYDTILASLVATPSMDGKALSQVIVDKYIDSYSGSSRQEKVTKSAVDMSGIETLHSKVVTLASTLVADFPASSGAVMSALNNSQSYEYASNHDLYDFSKSLAGQFPSGALHDAAQAVVDQMADPNFVVRNKSVGSEVAGSYGLAIYIPQANQISADQVVDELRDYSLLACNQNRATTWYDAVSAVMEGKSTDLVQGDFVFYVEWVGDADLDLYVYEPTELYAPWMGQTTPNGYFSGDSYDTGVSEEYYAANNYIERGQYDFLINYYTDGPVYNYADVTLWFMDATGDGQWHDYGPVRLDLSAAYVGDFSDLSTMNDLNNFSDWWYPYYTTRMAEQLQPVSINTGGRDLKITFKPKKRKPGLNR